jgi:hypothetical protein
MNFNDREKIIALTPLWKGERFPDGRPKVADKYLDALYGMTLEEVGQRLGVKVRVTDNCGFDFLDAVFGV